MVKARLVIGEFPGSCPRSSPDFAYTRKRLRPPLLQLWTPPPPSRPIPLVKPADPIERRPLDVEPGSCGALPHRQSPVDPIHDRRREAQRNITPATAPGVH